MDNEDFHMERMERKMWMRGPAMFGHFIASLFGIAIISLLFGYFVMLLWNWLMPGIFHVVAIDYWQSFGIVLLAKLLFGAPGMGRVMGWNRKMRKMRSMRENMDLNSGDDWDVRGGWHQWRYYKDYWRSEGKEAFEKYLNKMDGKTETKKRTKK